MINFRNAEDKVTIDMVEEYKKLEWRSYEKEEKIKLKIWMMEWDSY